MAKWVKRNKTCWDLYMDGQIAGYVVMTTYKNGTISYSGIAMDISKKKVSKPYVGDTLASVKKSVEQGAKLFRKFEYML